MSQMTKPIDEAPRQSNGRNTVLLGFLSELGNDLRSRSEPEFVYTAAAIASFGAVSWGVAALRAAGTTGTEPLVAAGGVLILAVAVISKIWREHGVYMKMRTDIVRIAQELAETVDVTQELIPGRLQRVGPGRGFLLSIFVVAMGALAAIAFCLSVYSTGSKPRGLGSAGTPANITFDRPAGSHSLAAAGQRDRSATWLDAYSACRGR